MSKEYNVDQRNIDDMLERQKKLFSTGLTKGVGYRLEQLRRLKEAIKKYEGRLMKALKDDLNKPEAEAFSGEVGFTINEVTHTIKHLRKWAKPKKVKTPLLLFPAKSYIYNEPYGVVFIMGPWNYPFNLNIAPLINSMAAGNCSIIKPSELAPATSSIMAEMIEQYFDPAYITVVEGGVDKSKELLEKRFDYIFFTGGTKIGKIVMEAASKHLIPLTLELGGKNPTIIDKNINMKTSARRILWGKFYNAGQTCIAPDYLLVHKDIKGEFLDMMKETLIEFYGDDPSKSKDYCRIIADKHFDRITKLLQGLDNDIVVGGDSDKDTLYIAPTIVDNVDWDSRLMTEEIFGPILPVLEYDDIGDIITKINQKHKPLTLYLFTNDGKLKDKVIEETSSGSMSINETLSHLNNPNLPFGGVGYSGIGSYHGEHGFIELSHQKSVLKKSFHFDITARYAPYKERFMKILRHFMK